jgi:tRNA U34 5-methylaminomethyl-2-thiouridine-forming methyltransferase MnmC
MEENTLLITQDGSHTLLSGKYGVSYHSRYGAIQESMHVFLQAGFFPKVLPARAVSILEIGFGSGLNALLTLLESRRLDCQVQYDTVEAYPISIEQAASLNYPELLLQPDVKAVFLQMHQSGHGELQQLQPQFSFRKWIQLFEAIDFQESFDVIYFDAFAPETQPALWNGDIMGRMFRALRPEGVLVTYCAKGAVKRTLKAEGFVIEAIPGPPGKREMTRAIKPRV